MERNLVAHAAVDVDANADQVWQALTSPQAIKRYMFGTTVESEWTVGSNIVWRGEFKGKRYEDKGKILRLEPGKLLAYSHYSPLSGLPDTSKSYHSVMIELSEQDGHTHVSLSQDNNPSAEARTESENNWRKMLEGLKEVVESPRTASKRS
jgi:uncharacterized protein YndB with AHSA1/START domain